MAWVLEVLTWLESVGPVCSSAPKTTRFFQHVFFGRHSRKMHLVRKSPPRKRWGLGKLQRWRGRPVCLIFLRFFEANSWHRGKQNSSSDYLRQLCYQNGNGGQTNSAWCMAFSCFSERHSSSWPKEKLRANRSLSTSVHFFGTVAHGIRQTLFRTNHSNFNSPHQLYITITSVVASVGFNTSNTTLLPALR